MSGQQLLELRGSVEEIVFRNARNGYSVLTLNCDGIITTAVGTMSNVSVGDDLKLIGVWKKHAEYGEQFSFEYYEHTMPTTSASILKYLSSGAIKGIGAVTAARLVESFGDATLEVMQNQPERMTEIKGITKEKALFIAEELRKIFGMREVMVFLNQYHISALEAVRIWKCFGDSAVSIIQENPYTLCSREIGVSFERADSIALSRGLATDAPVRIKAGIVYIITYNTGNGHTCLPTSKLIATASGYLKLPKETVEQTMELLIRDGALIPDKIGNEDFVFLPNFYQSEAYAAERLLIMLQVPPERIVGGELALESFEEEQGMSYAVLQRKAIMQALTGGLLILTGGPGTGKTTTLNAIIELYQQSGLKVLLAAPTGRAAQRMAQVTGCEAKTIHRLLEVEWDQNDKPRFIRNDRNLLDCDALIIDEMSMVDAALFESVLRALPLGCRLIMVGDSDQLPSVGAGNVLGDLIESHVIPVVQLTEIFRQSMESLIVTNAHKIVHGEMPEIHRKDKDFFFMAVAGKEPIAEKIVQLCAERLPAAYGFSPLNDIQVLCPGRKGDLGVTELNKRLQQVLNPPQKNQIELRMPVYHFRVGDKVMQTKNNYDLSWTKEDGTEGSGIYNGDIGVIESIQSGGSSAKLRFEDKLVEYDSEDLLNIELAYAATVHKSQGNEFEAVIIPMYYGPPQLYYRNLLYTAVTRAKKILILVGSVDVMAGMIRNDKKTKRYSGLREFLERGKT